MLITFTSKYSPDVIMFGDVASALLKAMGQSETPPGALQSKNIKSAADQLRHYLQTTSNLDKPIADEDVDDDEQADEQQDQRVDLSVRAKPLLDMLDKAYKEQEAVTWR
ncbi:MAG: DUF1840 domain-containing protein [Pseudomonadota bacterium]